MIRRKAITLKITNINNNDNREQFHNNGNQDLEK